MIKIFLFFIQFLLLFQALTVPSAADGKIPVKTTSYFPINNSVTLVYESSFGESTTKYTRDGEFTISSSGADNFRYRQTMIIKDDGVYVKETYQYLKIFLFIKKEAEFSYSRPLLRLPLPLEPGMQWQWQGDEYSDGDTNRVKVTGKALFKESVKTKAGIFEAIKVESLIEGASNARNRATEWFAEGIGLIKAKIIIEGGGVMGFIRDILGYGIIEFELKEIKKQPSP